MGNSHASRVNPSQPTAERRKSVIEVILELDDAHQQSSSSASTVAVAGPVETRNGRFRHMPLLLRTTLGYVDLGTDITTMVKYATLSPRIARIQGCVLLFSSLAQFTLSLGLGQPFWVGLVGLIGMKPLLEAWREAIGAMPFPKQKSANDQMLFYSRVLDMLVSCSWQSLVSSNSP